MAAMASMSMQSLLVIMCVSYLWHFYQMLIPTLCWEKDIAHIDTLEEIQSSFVSHKAIPLGQQDCAVIVGPVVIVCVCVYVSVNVCTFLYVVCVCVGGCSIHQTSKYCHSVPVFIEVHIWAR